MATTCPPPGCHTLTAHLAVRDAARAIDFYARAFNAREQYRLVAPDGTIGHAELVIGDSLFMLSDEYPDFGALSPVTIGGSPVKWLLYVEDADAAMRQALAAGATELRSVKDQSYGDRSGMVADPFGYSWSLATRIEEVSPAEMQQRFSTEMAGG
jgi:PhnB protein